VCCACRRQPAFVARGRDGGARARFLCRIVAAIVTVVVIVVRGNGGNFCCRAKRLSDSVDDRGHVGHLLGHDVIVLERRHSAGRVSERGCRVVVVRGRSVERMRAHARHVRRQARLVQVNVCAVHPGVAHVVGNAVLAQELLEVCERRRRRLAVQQLRKRELVEEHVRARAQMPASVTERDTIAR
jgi:hypothetical protein